MMARRLARAGLLFFAALAMPVLAAPPSRMKVWSGPEYGNHPQIARDIAKFLGRAADLDLRVAPSAGPVESLQRLASEGGTGLALLPSDMAHAYQSAAARGNPDAIRLFAPVRVISPLYDEEIYFIARSDSPMAAVQDIRDARINLGPLKGGTALSVSTLYRQMFNAAIAEDKASFLGHEEALVQLVTDKTLDVVAVVAPQPARLLADMKAEARRYIKLLRFDPAHPLAASALRLYGPATARAANYPNLLAEDLPVLSLTTYLVAYGHAGADADAKLSRFGRALCQGLPRLKAEGQAKWRDVELNLPDLAAGWHYSKAAASEIARCSGAAPKYPEGGKCDPQERVLGLCE